MPKRLLAGFQKFRQASYEGNDPIMPRLTAEGQDPTYFIISCIDSRSNPSTIFQTLPGTYFGHKAMGAIVRPYEKGTALSAALQFALNYNNVEHIIVLGHTGCGAIKALTENIDDEEISSFVNVARDGLELAQHKCGGENDHNTLLACAEKEVILQSAENLKGYPCVSQALAENRLTITSWLFDMSTGQVMEYDAQQEAFKRL